MNLAHWQLEPGQVAPVLLLGLAYRLRCRQLIVKGRPVARSRQLSFYSGLGVALLALISPLDWVGENRLFWVHMVQHLLLGDLAPLLVVLGLTGPILRPVLALAWVRRLRPLAHPLVALPLWILSLYLWHLPALYQAALRHDGIHALEHLSFFTCGALMWAAVIEPLPGPAWFTGGWKAVYTLTVRVAGAILANIFIWSNHAFYSYYAARDRFTGTSAVSDQRTAGAIMFIEGSVVTMLAFAWLFIRFTRETEVRQRLIESDLDEALAHRSARYGRSARVRDVTR
jgi:putative membrane protein